MILYFKNKTFFWRKSTCWRLVFDFKRGIIAYSVKIYLSDLHRILTYQIIIFKLLGEVIRKKTVAKYVQSMKVTNILSPNWNEKWFNLLQKNQGNLHIIVTEHQDKGISQPEYNIFISESLPKGILTSLNNLKGIPFGQLRQIKVLGLSHISCKSPHYADL